MVKQIQESVLVKMNQIILIALISSVDPYIAIHVDVTWAVILLFYINMQGKKRRYFEWILISGQGFTQISVAQALTVGNNLLC